MRLRRAALLLGVSPFALGAGLLGGCGDDDDGGSGSDEDYVADICGALKDFGEDIDNLEDDAEDVEDFEDIAKLLAGPIRNLADAMDDMNPPDDVKDWHDDATSALSDAADDLEDGNMDAEILSGDSPLPDPPRDVADRLAALAEDNEDCKDAEFAFGE